MSIPRLIVKRYRIAGTIMEAICPMIRIKVVRQGCNLSPTIGTAIGAVLLRLNISD